MKQGLKFIKFELFTLTFHSFYIDFRASDRIQLGLLTNVLKITWKTFGKEFQLSFQTNALESFQNHFQVLDILGKSVLIQMRVFH